jgi:hypothetical protein
MMTTRKMHATIEDVLEALVAVQSMARICNEGHLPFLRLTRQTRPLVKEGAPQKQDSNLQKSIFGQEEISSHKSQNGLETTVY